MNKLYLVLPILALLGTGVFIFTHQGELSEEQPQFYESETNPGCGKVSFTEWETCRGRANVLTCDSLKDESQRDSCYSASNKAIAYFWPSLKNTDPICQKFWSYDSNVAKSNWDLNKDDLYRKCFTQCGLINAAKQDKFYYRNIFAPLYLSCANLPVY